MRTFLTHAMHTTEESNRIGNHPINVFCFDCCSIKATPTICFTCLCCSFKASTIISFTCLCVNMNATALIKLAARITILNTAMRPRPEWPGRAGPSQEEKASPTTRTFRERLPHPEDRPAHYGYRANLSPIVTTVTVTIPLARR